MHLKFKKDGSELIVSLTGELDHHSAEEVRVKIDDRIDRDGIKNLILDFSSVTFMDSSGIGVVIGRYKKLTRKNGKVFIAGASKNVERVFQLSGLYKIIGAYGSIEEVARCSNQEE
ncbi:MAG: anti-sigma F factor antagonist [Clostridiaceae bacterium]